MAISLIFSNAIDSSECSLFICRRSINTLMMTVTQFPFSSHMNCSLYLYHLLSIIYSKASIWLHHGWWEHEITDTLLSGFWQLFLRMWFEIWLCRQSFDLCNISSVSRYQSVVDTLYSNLWRRITLPLLSSLSKGK